MKTIKYLGLGLLGILVVLLVWGLVEPYVLEVEEYPAVIPELPAAWEGRRIGVLADWQLGMWLDNRSTVRRSVERLVHERPAAVLIAGDIVYGPSDAIVEDARDAAALARPLVDAGIPTYAVLGNHDYGLDEADGEINQIRADAVHDALTMVGVTMLTNEARALALPPNDQTPAANTTSNPALYIVGIGDRWANDDNVDSALSQVPDGAPRVVFMHNPNTFAAFPAGSAPLAIAGHTHGGQVRIPFTPSWSWMAIVKQDEVHVDGWISGFGHAGNHLYVNRGIGFSIVPLRINCRPEVTILTLHGDRTGDE